MASDPVYDLLCELLFFSSFFFCLVATELLCIEYPSLSTLFFQHEDHQHVAFPDFEFPQRLKFPKFFRPSLLFTSRKKTNNSSILSLSSLSSSSSKPETEGGKSPIKTEKPLQVICEICAETKRLTEMIKSKTCEHSYCCDCMTKHVAIKIQDSITGVPCPGLGCRTVYELEACQPWLPRDLVERWDQALCEFLFLQVPKIYCPFKDCSAMMLNENEEDQRGAGETECPLCHRMFCKRCDVPWHAGVNCEEYQKLDENERHREDLLVRQLARNQKWGRCPKCKFYVEKTHGCLHITCRCKYEFCYACGNKWTSTHSSCQTT